MRAIRPAPIEPGMPVPAILLVAPPPIDTPKGVIAPKFAGAAAKGERLAAAIEQVAKELGFAYFDAATVVSSSAIDGVHLDPDQHLVLATALAHRVAQLLDG